jgi:hypothetical protein
MLDFNCTPHIDQVITQLGLVPRQCSLTFRILYYVDNHTLSNCVMNNPSTHSFFHSMLIHSLNLTVPSFFSLVHNPAVLLSDFPHEAVR